MSDFRHLQQSMRDINTRIVQLCIALNIDIHDEVAVRRLAAEATDTPHVQALVKAARHGDHQAQLKAELFGMIELMLRSMARMADAGMYAHGDEHWKVIGRALWQALHDKAEKD